ncbi:MAG TPA: ferritin-like domain-containing protein [Gemmataceae bacterium]|nr:ferritin-like domain-containing protein [Gemmataceae bacterium]
MKLDSLYALFVEELKDLYSAEHQLIKALPKMAKAASSPALKAAFTKHLKVTREQADRLERVFKQVEASPRGKKCKAMEGLIQEGKEIMEQDGEPSVLDAALIGAAQRVEHYEMAGYGCVRTYARQLGFAQAANLLQKTLDEEADADEELTELAESVINIEAEEADEEEEEGFTGRMKDAAGAVGQMVKSTARKVKRAVNPRRSR